MKKRFSTIIILMVLLIGIIPVFAEENDNFFAEENVEIEKKVNSTSFVAGNSINMSSEVDGINFVAGNNISLSTTQDHLFVAGNNINLENITTKDAFLAGSNISIQPSTIRDLYVAGETIRIDSNITRNAYLAGNQITINSKIDGDVTVASENIRIGKEAEITGTLKYPKDANISISNTAKVAKKKTYKGSSNIVITRETIVELIKDFIISLLAMIVMSVVVLKLNKKEFKYIEKMEKDITTVSKTIIKGLGTLVFLPMVAIMVMITTIGIPLSIISLILYVILIYLSSIPAAFYLGKWILKDKIKNDYYLLIISIIVIYLLKLLPVIGSIFMTLIILLGLGLYTTLIINKIKEK